MRRSVLLGLAGLTLLAGCDSLFGPDDRPPSQISRSTLPASVVVAEPVAVAVTVKDKDGKTLKGEDVTWSPTAGSVSSATSTTDGQGVARTTWTLGTVAGSQSLKATVRELETTFTVTAEPADLAALDLSPDGGTLASLGDTLFLTAAGTDAYGNAVSLFGLQWSSSAPGVAEVTAAGAVISHAEGDAEITASLAGVAASVAVVVDQVVVGVGVTPGSPVMARTETLQLEGLAVDARGAPVDTAVTVSWSSSVPAIAAVSADGLVEAVDVGTAIITASAPPFSGEVEVTVRAGPRPTITGISPAVLEAGAVATITGTGFSTDLSLDQVRVAGVPATVTAATATEITATMPPTGSFPCGPTGSRTVEVVVDGLAVDTEHPLAGATRIDLGVGEAVTMDAAAIGCNEVAAPGSYVMTVFNTSRAPTSTTGFKVVGSSGSTTTAALQAMPWAYTPSLRVDPAPRRTGQADPEVRAHLRMLDRNLDLLERLGPPARTASSYPVARVTAPPAVGDLRTFRIPDLDESNICTSYQSVTARAVFVGDHGVIWEDTVAPLAGTMNARWQELGTEFDDVMYPVLDQYIGDPLAYDAQLDGDGLFNMLFSRFVNDMEAGVAGFVFSGDFFPRPQCPSSDQGEIFYGRVPTVAGSGYDGNTADAWAWGMRSTVIHEVKHITSYALKLRDAAGGQPNYEEQWLEESTARLAEEFYARALFGYGQGDNVTYQESIYGEIRVGDNWPQYDPYPSIMVKHFAGLNDYLRAIESLSPIGKVQDDDWSFYGSGWLFVRWALDQSGAPEATFARALIDEDLVTGVANIEARTGRTFRELLGDFSLAIATDDYPGGFAPADPAWSHPSWNTRDIFAGLNDDYGDSTDPTLAERFDRPWPLRSRALPAGTFSASVPSLHGGTTTVFELAVPIGQPQLLRVLSSTDGPAPSVLGMALVRVQ